jgi:hypothetical protein
MYDMCIPYVLYMYIITVTNTYNIHIAYIIIKDWSNFLT